MTGEDFSKFDILKDIEYTRAALRALSAMTGALMAQGDGIDSYALGFEILLDSQEKKLRKVEEDIRSNLTIRGAFENAWLAATGQRIDDRHRPLADREEDHEIARDKAEMILAKRLATASAAATALSSGTEGRDLVAELRADVSPERQKTIELELKLKAGTVSRVLDELLAERVDTDKSTGQSATA